MWGEEGGREGREIVGGGRRKGYGVKRKVERGGK